MPFLSSIFRKDKDKDGPSSPSHSTFSRARSRPSIASSRECASPPPQLADISPQSDLSYVLPELEELQATATRNSNSKDTDSLTKRTRGLGFGRRRESTHSALVPSSPVSATSPPRPFSDMDIDRQTPMHAMTMMQTHTGTPTNHNKPNLHCSDSDDDPLVPPSSRASVFAGYSYSDQDRPRAQSVRRRARTSETPETAGPPAPVPRYGQGKAQKRRTSRLRRAISTDSSFSLKSFRHVGRLRLSNTAFSRSTSTGSPVVPSPTTTSTARPVPGRSTPTTRERVNSTSSEGMMTAGCSDKQPGAPAPTWLKRPPNPYDLACAILTSARPPTTRTWGDDNSSGSDRPAAGPRKSAPDTSSRKTTLENKPQPRKSTPAPSGSARNTPAPAAQKSLAGSDEEPTSPFAGRLGESGRTSPFTTQSESGHAPGTCRIFPEASIRPMVLGPTAGFEEEDPSLLRLRRLLLNRASTRLRLLRNPSFLHMYLPPLLVHFLPLFLLVLQGPVRRDTLPPDRRLRPNLVRRPRSREPHHPRLQSRGYPLRRRRGLLSGPLFLPRPTMGPASNPALARGPVLALALALVLARGAGEETQETREWEQPGFVCKERQERRIPRSWTRSSSERERVDAQFQCRRLFPFAPTKHRHHHPSHHPQSQQSRRPSVDILSHARRPSGFEVISRPKSPGPAAAVEPRPVQQTKTTDQLRMEAIEAMRVGSSLGPVWSAQRVLRLVWLRAFTRRLVRSRPKMRRRKHKRKFKFRLRLKCKTPRQRRAKTMSPAAPVVACGWGAVRFRFGRVARRGRERERGARVWKGGQGRRDEGRHGQGKDARPSIGHGLAGSPPARGNRSTTTTAASGGSTDPLVSNSAASPSSTASTFNQPAHRSHPAHHSRSNSDDQPGLTRERTITQRDAPPKIGVSLFDGPVSPRTRASHSTSAISAAATAKNSAALAEANRVSRRGPVKKHTRGSSFGAGSVSHVRAPAAGTDTDEDEEDESDESSEDDAPLSSLAPPKRPGSAASTAASIRPGPGPGPRPSGPQSRATAPLISSGNSSLRGSRSVEDLGRMPVVPSRPGPRPFITSPPSSTGDSSSGKAPLTPRDGSEAGRGRSDEARRKERRRSEAKKSVETNEFIVRFLAHQLGNVINGPGPFPNDDDEDAISMGHSQMGHAMGMMGMGWNQSGFFPPVALDDRPAHADTVHAPTPSSRRKRSVSPSTPTSDDDCETDLPPGRRSASHGRRNRAVERSSNMGGSVYGGSQSSMGMGGMGMMGMPMMGMYASSSYAASAYEGSVAGWGSASAYGGPSGREACMEEAVRGASLEAGSGPSRRPGQNRPRGKTQTGGSDAQPARREPVPPSTWATRRKAGM
ncbi:hypothetical protein RHS01_06560 [Rhizoctonia solani]|uniref:Uncharacterized protein n=1 Tax=Rhizoctonia solani TaxID=456999 RepID=A0A8H7M3M2_9AGAM|nr:hypothetical protein RHS01_06560 [Rhizoctonia solani]